MDCVIFFGTNFLGLKRNDAFMGFKIHGHNIFRTTHTDNHHFVGTAIGPSTKTTKIGTPRRLSHSQ